MIYVQISLTIWVLLLHVYVIKVYRYTGESGPAGPPGPIGVCKCPANHGRYEYDDAGNILGDNVIKRQDDVMVAIREQILEDYRQSGSRWRSDY